MGAVKQGRMQISTVIWPSQGYRVRHRFARSSIFLLIRRELRRAAVSDAEDWRGAVGEGAQGEELD